MPISSIDQVTDEAVAASYNAADERWKNAALIAIEALARSFETITPDDVWDAVSGVPEPEEKRALGGCMRLAAKRGWIEKIEGVTVPSRHITQHKNAINVWRSKLHPNYSPQTADLIPLTKKNREDIAYALKFVLDRYPTQDAEFIGLARTFGVRL